MIIHFSPIGVVDGNDYLITVEGDTIYIDGEEFDFSPIGLGDKLPAEACSPNFFQEKSFVTRGANGIELTVKLPHGPNAPYERRFMGSVTVTQDGDVPLPPYDTPAGSTTELELSPDSEPAQDGKNGDN
ncbi:hypothetical protein DFS21_11045 [Pseudomonas sp. 2848]|uniref:hypothetical protein n=1 Tax=Pseudomonas sp. 2848 TaxID=2183926 RepID=UPI000DB3F6F6|nr:hypothetical protein [Pseudomonas sp. 2848]PZW76593.1 hypothetical protein DFS21_11045 [Pseudomonas sp. 2848]